MFTDSYRPGEETESNTNYMSLMHARGIRESSYVGSTRVISFTAVFESYSAFHLM